ncbi:hypothetical protein ABFV74_00075 [Pseudoalteromonas distincta]|uniref:hypothetical protein n=1 Tax=Pseudoalteromonas distincta TaxID=77608 RepID=UPI003218897C
MKFWRNSSTEHYPMWKAFLMYIWVIPGVPIGTFLGVYFLEARNRSDDELLLSLLNYRLDFTLIILFGVGFILWVWSIRALSKPVFIIHQNRLYFYGYGFFKDDIALDSLQEIRSYNLGPLGHLIDFKSKVGITFRSFAFLSNINKSKLEKFFEESGIKVT